MVVTQQHNGADPFTSTIHGGALALSKREAPHSTDRCLLG
jgi:hypothetical protein